MLSKPNCLVETANWLSMGKTSSESSFPVRTSSGMFAMLTKKNPWKSYEMGSGVARRHAPNDRATFPGNVCDVDEKESLEKLCDNLERADEQQQFRFRPIANGSNL